MAGGVSAFPDGNSALMLVGARLRHIAGTRWGTRKYLDMKKLSEQAEEEARHELTVHQGDRGDHHEVGAEEQFEAGPDRLLRTVAALPQGGLAGGPGRDVVLGRADKGHVVAEDRLDHGAGVVDREPDAEREEHGKVEDLPLPVLVGLTLRGEIEAEHRRGRRHEDAQVENALRQNRTQYAPHTR